MVFIIIIIALVIAVIVTNIRIVPQSHAFVIERLGAYYTTWNTGLHVKVPFIDRIAKKVSLKEDLIDFLPQPVITKDNVTIEIDTVVYYRITDPKLYTYGIENAISAVENLTTTTLRNIVGELELDETLTSRDTINARMRSVIDEASDNWGIKALRTEVKSIIPPREIEETMQKQMAAERERREKIIRAEAEKQSKVLNAEGDKEAKILEAEADKQAAIKRAEGDAEAIRLTQKAIATGVQFLNQAQASPETIQLKGIDALRAMADGTSNTIVIPSEMQGIVGATSAIAGTMKQTIKE